MSKKLTSSKEYKRLHSFTCTVEKPYHPWLEWGPYVSERSWGVVREDYSADGDAWHYLPFDKAHQKAYRWGEDGIAGISDRFGLLNLSFSFWNHKDPWLKERLFGLSSPEGNHGEDVKECYWHLDSTPTHSHMRYLYKYPIEAFPYEKLREENAKRGPDQPEYELIDTGIFKEGYFDIAIEFAKADINDISIRIAITNCSNKRAMLDFIPQLVCRNRWAWDPDKKRKKPVLRRGVSEEVIEVIADFTKAEPIFDPPFEHPLKKYYIYADKGAILLFAENETVDPSQWVDELSEKPEVGKDAFHRMIVGGEQLPQKEGRGTKAALHYKNLEFEPEETKTFSLRLCEKADSSTPLVAVRPTLVTRKKEADDFFEALCPDKLSEEEKAIFRSALGGLFWSKQLYNYQVNHWLIGDNPTKPLPQERKCGRNKDWRHLTPRDVMLSCDKWEYPWPASWDLAFEAVSIALADSQFAKAQIWLMYTIKMQHPNGQIPACEWDFSDINPPLHAWAALQIYEHEEKIEGKGDTDFLARCFHKSLMEFSWWVNRVDKQGNNVFEGGFLGLDNITLFDRSNTKEGNLEQSDGTGWMGMFCLVLMKIALKLAKHDSSYEPLAILFFEHFVYIKNALHDAQERGLSLWDEEDGFFYDALCDKEGKYHRLKVRSAVGLIPLFAATMLSCEEIEQFPIFKRGFDSFVRAKNQKMQCVLTKEEGGKKRMLLSLVNEEQLKKILRRLFDPEEFLATYGIRSLSKVHEQHPFEWQGRTIRYEPGESNERIKGGNSNWRGPIWFPINYLLVGALRRYADYFGDNCTVLVGSKEWKLSAMADEVTRRLIALFKTQKGKRPYLGDNEELQNDPAFRDHLLFYEHFDPDTGRGLGASHQTGWTALIAKLMEELYS